jgi:hypothetical protein
MNNIEQQIDITCDLLDITTNEVDSPITILSNNNATVGLKVIGKLKQLPIEKTSSVFYLDKSTGKRFVIV